MDSEKSLRSLIVYMLAKYTKYRRTDIIITEFQLVCCRKSQIGKMSRRCTLGDVIDLFVYFTKKVGVLNSISFPSEWIGMRMIEIVIDYVSRAINGYEIFIFSTSKSRAFDYFPEELAGISAGL